MKAFVIFSVIQFLFASLLYSNVSNNPWTLTRGIKTGTRGGNTQGLPVIFDKKTTKLWKSLQEKNISNFEKDRRAILALQGEFKTRFEFLETVLLDTKLNLDIPYASWGTEFVKLVEDRGDFISLQHILVMSFKDAESGKVVGPYVVKHWRQDWTWEADKMIVFQGSNHWKQRKLRRKESKGKWKWSVYQVDDTPRYSTLGTWTHLKSASTFDTALFSRPLPRREFSVRSDYKLLLGKDSLILTPNSWYHEQRNFKHTSKLSKDDLNTEASLLSREIGHNSYERLKSYDFSVGYDYWAKSSSYWADVRFVWKDLLSDIDDFELKKSFEGKKLFQHHFSNAEDKKILKLKSKERRAFIKKLLLNFIK